MTRPLGMAGGAWRDWTKAPAPQRRPEIGSPEHPQCLKSGLGPQGLGTQNADNVSRFFI